MASFAKLFLRFFAIGAGFFLACVSAGLVYAFLARLILPSDFGRVDELELTVTLVVGVLGISAIFARAALLPALLMIAAFEFMRRRDWLSHALAGGALGLGLALVAIVGGAFIPPAMIAAYTACGIIAASVYWLVTGQRAGYWLPRQDPDQPGD